MNWYSYVDNMAKELAANLANSPQLEFEVQQRISMLPRPLQNLVWNKINFYMSQYLEQGGGDTQFFE
jgi:hypothetical protein